MPHPREVCEQAAKIGGKVLLELAGRARFREKGRRDFVTEADLRSQAAMTEFIRKQVSADEQIIAEEDTHDFENVASDQALWLIDPLDGTTNYVHGFPHFCASIALTRGGQVLAGAVFDPTADELFAASSGEGTTLNGRPISVSAASCIGDALVAASLPPVTKRDCVEFERFVRACESARSVRRTGSAALNLCYVACGRLDAYWGTTLMPWDGAAGVLMVSEAGGCVSTLLGQPFQLFKPDLLATATRELSVELQVLLNL